MLHRLPLAVAAFLVLAVSTARGHTFELDTARWDDQPQSVHVAGSFNGWSKTETVLTQDADRVYRAEVDLPDGVHYYKFVIDGERWINDPQHSDPSLEESDGHGGINSAVLVGPDPRDLPAPKDDAVNAEVVRHDPSDDARVVADAELFTLSVKAQAGDVKRVNAVLLGPDGGARRVELPRVDTALGYDRFAGMVPVDREDVRYVIELIDGQTTLVLGRSGEAVAPAPEEWPEPYRLDVTTDFETPDWARDAVWYQIFTERFRNGEPSNDPGDYEYENLLPWTIDWWTTYPRHGEAAGEENFYTGKGNVWNRRFGGDLQGVRDMLPYLRRLGVNALYFNPLFEGESMHKYDTADFRHIDDNFAVKSDTPTRQVEGETGDPDTWQWSASDRLFLDFVEEAHAQGFKVILDGVFNHVGRAHPFFQDVLAKGPESEYADWFDITDWGNPKHWRPMDDPLKVHGKEGGIRWNAWDGPDGHLPTFRKDEKLGLAEGPRQHIFDITRRWLAPDGDPSRGIDGWRLDVPGDIPHPFWRDWRKLVKDINPDAYISGEIWGPAQPWLGGDQFDAVMNYQFAMPMRDFFADRRDATAPSDFARSLTDVAYAYPVQVSLVQQNLLDSHDTDRFASMIVNPDLPYDGGNRLQDSGPNYDPAPPSETDWQRFEQAIVVQMTYLGAPMIYYGSEAGMWSPDDPSNRMPMVWPDLLPYEDSDIVFREPLFEHYQRLTAIRDALPALRRGFFRTVATDDAAGTLVYDRALGGEHVYVAINRSDREREVTFEAASAGELVDLLDPAAAAVELDDDGRPTVRLTSDGPRVDAAGSKVTLTLPPFGSAILADPSALEKDS